MLKMGFAEDVETILADTPDTKQVALFSATMPARSAGCRSSTCTIRKRSRSRPRPTTSATIAQRYLIVSYAQKIDALTRFLEVENFEGMIVFARTKSATEEIAEKLRARGYSAAAINGDIAQVPARAHRQPAEVGQARHPRGDGCRRPRPRRRAHLARGQLRHPHRHRVVRAPHRPAMA